ncbi:glycoside hydrolase [Geranomyces variabilis]|nr:glycoside hydrolase [Geranomyces variabilis]KAJ3139659.1 mannosyl-oligosaccharide alpha-1,2-mannosidase [Geranomyces variabilis]
MSQEPLLIDVRTRRAREDGFIPSPYDAAADIDFLNRRARPDRSHVVSIRWGAEDDADAARIKYNKAAKASGLWKRLAVYAAITLLACFGLWSYASRPSATPPSDASGTVASKVVSDVSPKKMGPPKVQSVWDTRAQSVVEAFQHAWKGYETHAWGYDELKPITHTHSTWMNVGMTIIDSLDTALVMDQPEIFQKALNWVGKDLKFDYNGDSNVFELTIRVLGGLLSAHHMTDFKHPELLTRAKELADILLLAFDTPSKLPLESINFATRTPRAANSGAGPGSTAEITTLALEFKYLAFLTGDKKYWDAVDTIGKVIAKLEKTDGLAPIFISTSTGEWFSREIRLGSRGDSYYEYLGKQYLLTSDQFYLDEYRKAVAGIRKHLLGISHPNEYFFIGELPSGVVEVFSGLAPKMDHLVCFMPGTLAVVATRGKQVATTAQRLALEHVDLLDLELAEELGTACWQQYSQVLTGLAPEIVYWNTKPRKTDDANSTATPSLAEQEFNRHKLGVSSPRPTTASRYVDGVLKNDIPVADVPHRGASLRPPVSGRPIEEDFKIHPQDAHNLLRPETIESFFVLYRVTGDPIWRERGWEMFQAFEKWCKVEGGGYTSLNDVRVEPPPQRDKMETFFLGETLKYFYLLFANPPANDDNEASRRLVNLEKFVLNTEAHPLPIFQPPQKFQ